MLRSPSTASVLVSRCRCTCSSETRSLGHHRMSKVWRASASCTRNPHLAFESCGACDAQANMQCIIKLRRTCSFAGSLQPACSYPLSIPRWALPCASVT